MRAYISSLILALLVAALLSSHADASGYSYRRTHVVKPQHSIQKAINKASPGDRIVVEAGTYEEQLVIKKSGIELIGKPGAKLRRPTPSYTKNLCTGIAPNTFVPDTNITHAGICIHGEGIAFAKGPIVEHRKIRSVKERIRGVSVSGFDISGFNGLGIAILGAKDTVIFKNKLSKSGVYGALTVFSKNTRIFENKVQSPKMLPFIGICMDDKSDVYVIKNNIFGYLIGLCVQTNGADVRDNEVSGGCIGVYIDPG
jgi:nitrous oxidase accessory protein NosD